MQIQDVQKEICRAFSGFEYQVLRFLFGMKPVPQAITQPARAV